MEGTTKGFGVCCLLFAGVHGLEVSFATGAKMQQIATVQARSGSDWGEDGQM